MTQDEYDVKFREITTALGYVPSIAATLAEYLWAATGQHRVSKSAVDYVLGRLWVEDSKKGSSP